MARANAIGTAMGRWIAPLPALALALWGGIAGAQTPPVPEAALVKTFNLCIDRGHDLFVDDAPLKALGWKLEYNLSDAKFYYTNDRKLILMTAPDDNNMACTLGQKRFGLAATLDLAQSLTALKTDMRFKKEDPKDLMRKGSGTKAAWVGLTKNQRAAVVVVRDYVTLPQRFRGPVIHVDGWDQKTTKSSK